MKKTLALLLVLVMVLALGACAPKAAEPADETPAEATPATEGTALKVGVFYYNYGDTYISNVRNSLDGELTALGVTYQNFDGNNNQTTQNEQIQTAITDGYNLLVVNQVTSGSSDTAKGIIEMAGEIPVIFFNRAIEGEGEDNTILGAYKNICFIGTDAPEAGHMQGKMIGDYVLANYDKLDLNGDGTISYAMFKGDEANVEAIYRTQFGVEDADAIITAAGKPALAYFDANNTSKYQVDLGGAWSAAAALEYMNTNLSQYNAANKNMIELIICNNDNMAEGCISALNAAGYNTGDEGSTTIPVFGVDATPSAVELVEAGKMTGTVKQDYDAMAKAIAAMVKATQDGTAMADGVTATVATDDMFSVAEGFTNKLFVAYAPYTA